MTTTESTTETVDAAWADPNWQIDSATRTCCGCIGAHARGCMGEKTTQDTSRVVPLADSAAMTTALADPAPPPGSEHIDDWGSGGDDRRIVLGATHRIIDSDVTVSFSCIQWRDGHIESGSDPEPPMLYLDGAPENLNADQARHLAAVLLALAAQVDGWVK
ncbi:hypothetical protein MCHIJ_30440 [Mycolicibacterium chitae]|uniref:Uncharacterized protein n=1 Tax=Mycolicibacterium chitae TaxID=1792 RepID=A0A448I4P0_MYCCI|nr:hypothetical protein [Mycolicibacterium chitae]MCV7108920.1 hypothetical protein [Mycolicibacterium chitae]BBZ03607.1 hypothetical protein MCHIJ_30440 [Mycolicibacterium chitae]VEG47262.1 Uncharacterised protein [Mycolicibacterium chitae]